MREVVGVIKLDLIREEQRTHPKLITAWWVNNNRNKYI